MPYVIANPCVGVKGAAFVDVCPSDCIQPTKDEAKLGTSAQLYTNPDDCIDCALASRSAQSPRFPLEELPEKWKHFVQIDAEWYARSRSEIKAK